jgi:drug/metabolite transporter (DMT)-like permease
MASLWMVLASFAFAAMGAGVKLASSQFSTSEIVMYRGLIGTLMLVPIVRHRGGVLRTAFGRAHLWRSIVGVVSLWLWFFAIGRLPLATAVTLNYMGPIWLAAWLFLTGWWGERKHPEWPLLLAIGMSFVGVVLVLRPALESNQWLGGFSALASSVIAAMAFLQVRRLGQMGEPEYRIVFYFSLTMAAAGLIGTLLAPLLEPGAASGFHRPTPGGLGLLLAISASGLLAQMAMTRAYSIGKVLVVANLQYTGIVFSSLWGMALWGDRFGWQVWLGMGVILASGLAVTFYNTRKTARGAVVDTTDPIASEV